MTKKRIPDWDFEEVSFEVDDRWYRAVEPIIPKKQRPLVWEVLEWAHRTELVPVASDPDFWNLYRSGSFPESMGFHYLVTSNLTYPYLHANWPLVRRTTHVFRKGAFGWGIITMYGGSRWGRRNDRVLCRAAPPKKE